jgi:HlyD family secretion protein
MTGGMLKLGGGAMVAALAVFGLGRYAGLGRWLGRDEAQALEGAEVKRGPLRISVLERANLKAAKSINLKCELEGRTTILWLIEEGTLVEAGELVCQLDTSQQVQRKVEQEIAVQNAEAAYVKARQNLAIQESQNESDVKTAEQELSFAEQDKTKYLEGEYPQNLQAADEEILLAEEDATRKFNELDWSRKLEEKGFLTRTQLDADEFAYNSARVKLEQARRAKTLLESYDHPRKSMELQAAIEESRRELDRVKLQAKARITDFEADTSTSLAKLNLERDELEKLVTQIEKAQMTAPVAGMVVYAKEDGGRWGGGDPIQEGTEVRERQDIITIPSSQGMVAEMSLHESVLEKVNEGMPCIITVEALPGRQFTGRVRFKSTLPDQNSWWANPDLRVYRTEIEVAGTEPGLKSGMSCSVEVVVAELPDALYVPVQSVFIDAGKTAAFVSDGGSVDLRAIEVGLDNGKWVQVLTGLAEGEVVLLAQPAGFQLKPALEEKVSLDDIPAVQPTQRGGPGSAGAEGETGDNDAEDGKRERPAGGDKPGGKLPGGKPAGGGGVSESSEAGTAEAESAPAAAAGTVTDGGDASD